ncbi:C39 family peptidase, partial [Furfurilactobacillus entadae]|uniref:C39 family peptidase n=1 Tax=Furfurilactobacillus entadae TaxID=2922307 RepID=UPI0038B27A63
VYYNANGQMVYGEAKINNNWYLFSRDDGAMQRDFQNLANYGHNKTVYYNANGQMVYGEAKINNNWYLFSRDDGAMQRDFQNLANYGHNKTVYYNANGQMVYGEAKINNNWYLFSRDDGAMQYGFQNMTPYNNNKTVYYDGQGHMLYGEQRIHGDLFRFDNTTGALYFVPFYYAQNDPRWGYYAFGGHTVAQTACVLTSIAMVVSGYGYDVEPLQVAQYGYANTRYNHGIVGTDQAGLIQTAHNYGLNVDPLYSAASIKDAIEHGHAVVMAVRAPFIPASWGSGTTHEVVLSQYSNGNVYVQDPLHVTTGWHSLDYIWNCRSNDADDINATGTPAEALHKD